MELQEDEIEIDLREILFVLLRRWWAIALSLIIGASLAAGVTQIAITPQYQATSMIYILSKTTSISSAIDIQLGKQLTVDFEILATSRPVIEKVIEELGLEANYEQVVELITVENPDSSQILRLICTNPDPVLARDIANSLANATADRVAEIMATDRPTIAETAIVAQNPVSPSMMKNTAIGGFLAACLAAGIIILQVILDDTVKKEDDVTKYLGLNTLAAIPMDNKNARVRKKEKKQSRKKEK
ncbi:MAG: polysaccharide export protein [Clostridia bacterium]|nr:polysaccharide export protein [Clostridia bacterium]NCC44452.1 polysaccharide export protein [Clostridia bacterium]